MMVAMGKRLLLLWAMASPVAALTLASVAPAAPVQVDASFDPSILRADTFTLRAQGAAGVTKIRFDLSGSETSFDPREEPFRVLNDGGTGFDGMFISTALTLELSFLDFDPGETFIFSVEVDDDIGFTTTRDFRGSLLEVTFAAAPPNVLSSVFNRRGRAMVLADVNGNGGGGGNVPEPAGASLLLLGLYGLWRSRRSFAG